MLHYACESEVVKNPIQIIIFVYNLNFCSSITGDDFSSTPFTVTVPATEDNLPGAIFYTLPYSFNVTDDDVNEIEQSFALVAELMDVPDNFACFQQQVGDTRCFGRTGATLIKIVDNDGMLFSVHTAY